MVINTIKNRLLSKKAEISVNTIIGIVILLITLFVLLAIIITRGNYLDTVWSRGPFG